MTKKKRIRIFINANERIENLFHAQVKGLVFLTVSLALRQLLLAEVLGCLAN